MAVRPDRRVGPGSALPPALRRDVVASIDEVDVVEA
jgi:hypothetical protein